MTEVTWPDYLKWPPKKIDRCAVNPNAASRRFFEPPDLTPGAMIELDNTEHLMWPKRTDLLPLSHVVSLDRPCGDPEAPSGFMCPNCGEIHPRWNGHDVKRPDGSLQYVCRPRMVLV